MKRVCRAKGQSTIELVAIVAILALCLAGAIKTSGLIQDLFKHDFIKPSKNTLNDEIAFSKNILFFKSKKEAKEFKKQNPESPILILNDIGVLYED